MGRARRADINKVDVVASNNGLPIVRSQRNIELGRERLRTLQQWIADGDDFAAVIRLEAWQMSLLRPRPCAEYRDAYLVSHVFDHPSRSTIIHSHGVLVCSIASFRWYSPRRS